MTPIPFLRPALTNVIVQRLVRGDSLNIYGEPGIGKTRLLEDIKGGSPDRSIVVSVSIRGYQYSYGGFCRAIWAEARCEGDPPSTFGGVVDALSRNQARIFLFIDHFQSILSNPDIDPAYDQAFIDTLNAVKNKPNMSLLLVSSHPINTLILFVDKAPMTSVLHLDPIKVRRLSQEEIFAELDRKLPDLHLDDRFRLGAFLSDHERHYDLLNHMITQIAMDAPPKGDFNKRLQAWHRDFEKERNPAPIKRMVKLNTWIKAWGRVVPMDKVKSVVPGAVKLLKKLSGVK